MPKSKSRKGPDGSLPKCPTGIKGIDEITQGGLPLGRTTLVCGAAGSGKTVFGMEFLVHGALEFGEPGVCMSFEETADELIRNMASFGFDLNQLAARRKVLIDYVVVERSQIEETGEYDLDGLFVRLAHAIDSIGAKRVVLDTIESLFASLSNEGILRAELRRLFRWLKNKGVTAVVTGERGDGTFTRHGLEEYISDCMILLDSNVEDAIFTRRMRIVKYRGSTHGTNEYPFLIGRTGLSVLPLTSLSLDHPAPVERISTGVPDLDAMVGGKGFYRGSSIMISGTAGTGKTTLAAHFADAACRRGERCLYLGIEESVHQLVRNMRSVGLDLGVWVDKGLLRHHAARADQYGLEMHLVGVHEMVDELKPRLVVIDPISSLLSAGTTTALRAMLVRLVDFLTGRTITTVLTTLSAAGDGQEATGTLISSNIDAWLLLRDIESGGERNRALYVLKARGLAHSNQVREFLLTNHGVELRETYLGATGVLRGSARLVEEARVRAEELTRQQDVERKRFELERKRRALESQIEMLRAEAELQGQELKQLASQERQQAAGTATAEAAMRRSRGAVVSLPAKRRGAGK